MQILPTIRILFKDKLFSITNIVGLAIALCCSFFAFLFAMDEFQYDQFHADYDRIYRVVRDIPYENGITSTATTAPVLAKFIKTDLPEIESVVRIFHSNRSKILFHHGAKSFYETGMYDTDSSIFNVFTFPFIKGDAATALTKVEDIILTASTAKRYFGDAEPLGQTITVEDQYVGRIELTVSGVIQDVPPNSHFHFDFLRPAEFMLAPKVLNETWGFPVFHTYVKLKDGSDPALLEEKIRHLVQRYNPEDRSVYHIQPLTSIHLHSALQYEIEPNGDFKNLIILITLAGFIMVVAGINYVNFSLAKGIGRAREVGIRKASGAWRGTLVRQFLGESLITVTIAFVLALLFVISSLPIFNQFTGQHYSYSLNADVFLWSGIVLIALVLGAISGFYPALYLSSFSAIRALRNDYAGYKQGLGLRNILLGVQFAFSVSLVICTAIIVRQMNYILFADLGYEPEQVIVIPDASRGINRESFRQQLLQYPEIVNVGASSGMISENNWHGSMHSQYSDTEISTTMCNVDSAFFKTLKFNMLEMSPMSTSDSVRGIVLNEAAVKALGLTSPIGEPIFWPGNSPSLTVIGVVQDFHVESLHEKISPVAFQFLDQFLSIVFIRINTNDMSGAIQKIESAWNKVAPDRPLQYYFLDNHLEMKYRAEMKLKSLVICITIIAVVISFIGLFGVTALLVKNKTKEIAIRKVLGASVPGIIFLLVQRQSLITLISTAIALPASYIIMERWLEAFAYRIQLTDSTSIFILTALTFILLVILTTVAICLKAVFVNPARVIKGE